MGQTQTGSTLNAIVSQDANTGDYRFYFDDPFNMLINLQNTSSTITIGGALNDRFNLMNSSNLIINGNNGNDIFNISATAGGLNGSVIHGGTGKNFITMTGSNTSVDLTQGSSGISAVVGNFHATGESVTLALSQLSGSALTDGGTGRAFAAVIGADGVVNLTQSGKFKLVGSIDAAQQGYDANGQAITGAALTSLLSKVTQISSITGNLASLYGASYTGKIPANETEVKDLNAYVFSDGTKNYTIWSDGTVNSVDAKGNATAFYQPAAVSPSTAPTYGLVPTFDKSGDWAGANISTNAAGISSFQLIHGNTLATTAINLASQVTGATVHGDNGANGANYFGLGGSGGNNTVYGSKAGNTFDLQTSTSLKDVLIGGVGFDVVHAGANGADVDLTAGNATTSLASKVDAVVGSAVLSAVQTVEVDATSLKTAKDASGVNTAVFEAMLGSSSDTLHFTSSKGQWVDLGSFAPGSALPAHAVALSNADVLDALFHSGTHTAENSLTGHLFERVDAKGHALEFVTVYTDATLDNQLTMASPAVTALAFHLL